MRLRCLKPWLWNQSIYISVHLTESTEQGRYTKMKITQSSYFHFSERFTKNEFIYVIIMKIESIRQQTKLCYSVDRFYFVWRCINSSRARIFQETALADWPSQEINILMFPKPWSIIIQLGFCLHRNSHLKNAYPRHCLSVVYISSRQHCFF